MARNPAIELPVPGYGLGFSGSELPFPSPIAGFPSRELAFPSQIARKPSSIAHQPALEVG